MKHNVTFIQLHTRAYIYKLDQYCEAELELFSLTRIINNNGTNNGENMLV